MTVSFGPGTRVYRNHYAAFAGNNLIAKSDPWEIRCSHYVGSASSQVIASERAEQLREKAYQEVFQHLATQGWGPVGADEDGSIMSFRRSSTSTPAPASLASELERLSILKKRGTLTDSEFQAAQKKLLG